MKENAAMWKSLMSALMAALLLSACATSKPDVAVSRPVDSAASLRALSQGKVSGFETQGGKAHVWRAIPFAAPPVGDLRWKAPRPAARWEGTRSGLAHAPWCLQVRSALDDGSSADAIANGALMGQEDCLYLNVYAPWMTADQAASAKLPVMMWIHGGSNTWGRAEQYDPSAFVAKENVIVAVIQYRLGPMGWFAHPDLRASAATEEDRTANFATLDQIAALKWLKTNAAAFGGDAANITVFGESAGGHNVAALLASPKAKGLFQRAIIQSGSFRSVSLADADSKGGQSGTAIAAKLAPGATGAALTDALRKVDANAIYAAFPSGGAFEPYRIIQDGIVLPTTPMRDAFQSPETFNAVPIMTGTNRDEVKLFSILNPKLVTWRMGLIPKARDPKLYNASSDYQSRAWRAAAVDGPASLMTAGGHKDVWSYRFDWDEQRTYMGANFSQLFGAAHSLEIPFVFGQYRFLGRGDQYVFTKKNEPGRLALSASMMGYWAEFARSGNPARGTVSGSPEWARWTSAEGAAHLMVFDTPTPRMIEDRDSPARIVQELSANPDLKTAERCAIASGLRGWIGDEGGTVAGCS